LGHTRETSFDRAKAHLRFRPTPSRDCKGRATCVVETPHFYSPRTYLIFYECARLRSLVTVASPNSPLSG
jgi:hypothetical protein